MIGDLIPETYPFNFSRIFDYNYFWLKYYISQRTFFSIPKRPIYVNYEVLCNSLATNVVDLSKAEIYELRNNEMSETELETFLAAHNEYTFDKFALRFYQMKNLDNVVEAILNKDETGRQEEKQLLER